MRVYRFYTAARACSKSAIRSSLLSGQDIRPLKILLLNLMPTKIATETQLSRLLSNTPLQVELELMPRKSMLLRRSTIWGNTPNSFFSSGCFCMP